MLSLGAMSHLDFNAAVRASVSQWMDFADRAGAEANRAEKIRSVLRLELPKR